MKIQIYHIPDAKEASKYLFSNNNNGSQTWGQKNGGNCGELGEDRRKVCRVHLALTYSLHPRSHHHPQPSRFSHCKDKLPNRPNERLMQAPNKPKCYFNPRDIPKCYPSPPLSSKRLRVTVPSHP